MQFWDKIEQKLGKPITAILLSAFLYLVAWLYIKPSGKPGPHGLLYIQLSEHPWDFSLKNECRFRILAPLLGYLTGLKGNYFALIPFIFSLVMIAGIYILCRKKECSPTLSLVFTTLLGLSTLRFLVIFASYYVDGVYLCWIFLAFAFVNRPILRNLFFLFALFTHECTSIFLPGLAVYALSQSPKPTLLESVKILSGLGIGIGLLLLFQHFLSQHAEIAYKPNFYFNWNNIQYSIDTTRIMAPLGIFYSFKFAWLIIAYSLYLTFKHKDFLLMFSIFLIILATFSQLAIAYDTGRLMNLAFPALIISFLYLKDKIESSILITMIGLMIILNLLCSQYYIVQWEVVPITRF